VEGKEFSDLEMRVQILEHRYNNRPCARIKNFFKQLWHDTQAGTFNEDAKPSCCAPGSACDSPTTVILSEVEGGPTVVPSKKDVVGDMVDALTVLAEKEGYNAQGIPISILINHGLSSLKIDKLVEGGVTTIEALDLMNKGSLLKFNGLGQSSVAKILAALEEHKRSSTKK